MLVPEKFCEKDFGPNKNFAKRNVDPKKRLVQKKVWSVTEKNFKFFYSKYMFGKK